jgi:hypothetical protein
MCADLNAPGNPWGASLADRDQSDGRVCVVPGAAPQDANQAAGYCQWTPQDAGRLVPYIHDAAAASPVGVDASSDAALSDAQ